MNGTGDDSPHEPRETDGAPDMNDHQVQLVVVLGELWGARNESPGKPWSLAKLSKRAQLPMSTLRRLLTELTAAELVDVEMRPDGTGSVALTEQGAQVCADLFSDS
ncbi:ArsR family transcriptional regulator [Paraburkholderia sp. SARCC-3016]|uniref:ArsR family transcriptional regulator n=1 Tax=Paraburkholderia sp. SARCC-3016 TaxID=3058611 RepID=UPI0028080D6C|nr:ArsR family transcriptional regulator [Paraburkholderia sp. SARCC-3016]MDQ7978355.1 ArsR family transcriptional regulator [Paraburkholderia sp. SARCC-3016]